MHLTEQVNSLPGKSHHTFVITLSFSFDNNEYVVLIGRQPNYELICLTKIPYLSISLITDYSLFGFQVR
jgi:hypothetical protein